MAIKSTSKPLSVTSVTKRDKRDILKTGLRAVKRDNPPYKGGVASRHPGTSKKAIPVMVLKQEVPESELKALLVQTIRELRLLRAEVLIYCNAYISRGIHAEGVALARLRKAAER